MRRGGAAVLAAFVIAGCGGEHPQDLSWDGKPQLFRPRGLPRDRILLGKVRNTSKHTLHLRAAGVVVRDGGGRRLKASAGFTTSYAHGLFGAFQQPRTLPHAELVRLGRIADLPPGATAPFYAAWRLTPATKGPVRIDYGTGTLSVPSTARTTAP